MTLYPSGSRFVSQPSKWYLFKHPRLTSLRKTEATVSRQGGCVQQLTRRLKQSGGPDIHPRETPECIQRRSGDLDGFVMYTSETSS